MAVWTGDREMVMVHEPAEVDATGPETDDGECAVEPEELGFSYGVGDGGVSPKLTTGLAETPVAERKDW
jgi:hypothetical protein